MISARAPTSSGLPAASLRHRAEQTAATLSTIHASIIRMGLASETGGDQELAGQVRDLREQVDALSAGMNEAYARGDGPAA